MNSFACPLRLVLFLAAFVSAGCAHLDTAAESSPDRVVSGTVTLGPDIIFPADTIVLVRVIDNSAERPDFADPSASVAAAATPVASRAVSTPRERVLGFQEIKAPAGKPVPFRVEFPAEEAVLRRGVFLDVRISYHGAVQFRTLRAHPVTLSSIRYPQEVTVDASL